MKIDSKGELSQISELGTGLIGSKILTGALLGWAIFTNVSKLHLIIFTFYEPHCFYELNYPLISLNRWIPNLIFDIVIKFARGVSQLSF